MKRTAAPVSAAIPPEAPIENRELRADGRRGEERGAGKGAQQEQDDQFQRTIAAGHRRPEDHEPDCVEEHVLPTGMKKRVGEGGPQQRPDASGGGGNVEQAGKE